MHMKRFVSCTTLATIVSALFVSVPGTKALDGPLSPQDSLKAFQVEPGLKVELVAAEPMVVDPVAIAFDERGRMYVAEDRGYPTGPGKGKPPAGQIVLLEDTNSDGKFDKRTVFAEGLSFPNGIMPWKGGIYVTCAPDVFYFKDTSGDGVSDVKKLIFTGFQHLSTTQLRASHPTLNIDNWVYMNCGLTASKLTSPECKNREPLFINRLDFRFRPETCDYEEYSGTGQFGGTFDAFGRRFICSNRNHNQHVVMQGRHLRRNPYFNFAEYVQDIPDHGAAARLYSLSHNITTAASHTGYFTSACGLTVYTGNELPETYWGNSFTCEPAGNLIHRDILTNSGATFVASRAYPTNEFLASPDNWFRPVNLANGPDGALYICDMYRKTIEHPDYLPEATRKVTDFESGKDKGRIYKVVSVGKRGLMPPADFTKHTAKDLCLELNSKIGWRRMTAHRLLLERKDTNAIPTLKTMANFGKAPEARAHALNLLNAFDALDDKILIRAMSDSQGPVREHAVKLAEARVRTSPQLATTLLKLADDYDAKVRFQCALVLGEVKNTDIVPALVKIASRDSDDRWTRAAILSSIGNYPHEFLVQMLPLAERRAKNDDELNKLIPLLTDLGRTLGSNPNLPSGQILRDITSLPERQNYVWELALLSGYAEGLRSSKTNNAGAESPLTSALAGDQSNTPAKVQRLMERAVGFATDPNQSLEKRLASIALLSHGSFAQVGAKLQSLIDPQQPSEVQIAAARALCQMNDEQAATALVSRDHWRSYTQPVKEAVLAAMISQPKLLNLLLTAIEKGDVSPTSINPEKRNQLMKHKDEEIAKRASALFKDLNPGDRMKVLEEYKSVLNLKGNSENGHKIFSQTCTACHTFSGEGHAVGPDLTGIRNQPADVLLLHIIVPEYEIMPIYTQYNVETKDGKSISGILAGETPAAITLKQAAGIEEKVSRANIASMSSSSLSLMPQELEKTMSKQDLADLLSFLKGQ